MAGKVVLMRLEEIDFQPGEEGAIPAHVTVRMTVQEAAWIGKLVGRLKAHQKPKNFDVFGCLIGDVFNRYWDDGVDGAMRELGIQAPPEMRE